MPCCWAGSDGEFNSLEIWRAICIYITVIVFSPIVVLVVSYLVKMRQNQEMRIREPKAVLVMVIFLWTYILCQDMHHLILNLEAPDIEIWKSFNNDDYYLSKVGVICYLGGMTAFFYRGWMFWFKSGAGREATAFLWAMQRMATDELPFDDEPHPRLRRRATILPYDDENQNTYFSNRRRQLANPKIIGGVLVLFFLMAVTVHIVLHGQEDEHEHRIWLLGLVFFVIGCVEVYLLRNVEDKLGTLKEYKVVTVVAILQWGALLVIELSGKTYYILLAELEVQTVSMIICIIWLRLHIGSFRVDETSDSPSDVTLSQVLSHENAFLKFVEHTKENMCFENLAFFVDMYALRKTLGKDPFIALTVDDSTMIRDCATLKMTWIDQSISRNTDNVPSAKDIFQLYVPPYSEMEVNIPGRMRKQLVVEFEQIPEQKRFSTILRQRTKDIKDSMRIVFGTDDNRTRNSDRELVVKLYPVWKTLLSLLDSDTLVRFKRNFPGFTISKEDSGLQLGYTPGKEAQEALYVETPRSIQPPDIEMSQTAEISRTVSSFKNQRDDQSCKSTRLAF